MEHEWNRGDFEIKPGQTRIDLMVVSEVANLALKTFVKCMKTPLNHAWMKSTMAKSECLARGDYSLTTRKSIMKELESATKLQKALIVGDVDTRFKLTNKIIVKYLVTLGAQCKDRHLDMPWSAEDPRLPVRGEMPLKQPSECSKATPSTFNHSSRCSHAQKSPAREDVD